MNLLFYLIYCIGGLYCFINQDKKNQKKISGIKTPLIHHYHLQDLFQKTENKHQLLHFLSP